MMPNSLWDFGGAASTTTGTHSLTRATPRSGGGGTSTLPALRRRGGWHGTTATVSASGKMRARGSARSSRQASSPSRATLTRTTSASSPLRRSASATATARHGSAATTSALTGVGAARIAPAPAPAPQIAGQLRPATASLWTRRPNSHRRLGRQHAQLRPHARRSECRASTRRIIRPVRSVASLLGLRS